MSKVKPIQLIDEQDPSGFCYDALFSFKCPGCGFVHTIPVGLKSGYAQEKLWDFNGDTDKPTFNPSILVTCGRYVEGWVDDGRERTDAQKKYDFRCHSWVRDGNIEFQEDCSHLLAGQTVELPEITPDFLK